jgi:clan AA aspartic protease (TIGR02281 family)
MKQALQLILLLACGTAHGESVVLKQEHGTLVVPVLINNEVTLDFTIDSGASDVSIPADVFSTLTRAGTVLPGDLLKNGVYELADGSKHEAKRFRIRSLKIGHLELRNVTASVVPQAGPLLLGQSFLERLQSWSIDNRSRALLINESPVSAARNSAPGSKTAAQQGTWWHFGKSHDGSIDLMADMSTVRFESPSYRRVWVKHVYQPRSKKGIGVNADNWKSYTLYREKFDCDEETRSYEAGINVYDDGARTNIAEDYPTPEKPVVIGSAGYKLMWRVCAKDGQ